MSKGACLYASYKVTSTFFSLYDLLIVIIQKADGLDIRFLSVTT